MASPGAYHDVVVWHAANGRSFLAVADCARLLQQLPANSVDCVWTDPPYFLSNGGVTCCGGRLAPVDKGAWDRSRGTFKDVRFHTRWVRQAHRVLRPGGTIWVSATYHAYPYIGLALSLFGFRILNDVIWEKPSPPPNLGRRCFTHATETLLWAAKVGSGVSSRYTFDYEEMCREAGGRQMKNVWRFPPPSSEEKRFGNHPTQKPVALIARCLRACTRPGETIVDPFAGSGSTGVAALRLGRVFIGCDSDREHAQLAARRLRFEDQALSLQQRLI